jgi:hypothetical protein
VLISNVKHSLLLYVFKKHIIDNVYGDELLYVFGEHILDNFLGDENCFNPYCEVA